MLAGGGEVMGEGVTAELVIGRTEKKLLMLMLRIARDWWSSGNFFRGSLLGDSASFTAYYFGLAKLHKLWFHKDGPFVAQQKRSTAEWGCSEKEKEKQIPLE